MQPNHKLHAEQVDELVAGYLAGRSLRALGRQLEIHEQTVRAHLKRRGVELRPGGCSLTAQQQAELVVAYQTGISTYRLAQELSVSPDTVRRLLLKAGVHMRDKTDWRGSGNGSTEAG